MVVEVVRQAKKHRNEKDKRVPGEVRRWWDIQEVLDALRENPGAAIKSIETGVSWHGASSKWRAQHQIGGKSERLGYFVTEEEASARLKEAQAK